MDEVEKTTTQEKMDVGTDNNQQKGEEHDVQQKIYVGQLSEEEASAIMANKNIFGVCIYLILMWKSIK